MLKEIRKRIQQGFIASGAPSLQSSVPPSPTSARGLTVSIEELLRLRAQAAGLDFSPQRRVLSTQAGGYVSPYRGRGMEFEEVRAYQPGDDIRNMDWRVTARTGRPHTKLFREERERPVLFLVDLGPSMAFGTRVAFKSVVAARAAALLAWAARDNGDRIGGIVFAGKRHRELRPAARERGMLPFLKALVDMQLTGIMPAETGNGHWVDILRRLASAVRPGSLVFLLSDFHGLPHQAEQSFARLAAHNDMISILIFDPVEVAAPPAGRYPLSDGQRFAVLDTGDPTVADAYRNRFASHRDAVRALCHRHGSHFLTLATNQPVPETLRRGLIVHHRRPGARTTRP
ncbi:MAG: DUF58 domain-containing protein [Candidatus Competibacter sp.]|jgi:uncharacterized protein (DUF58 family)|nr:DUF58 domain-containing protein [Candidatus Competibacter sp.]